MKTFIGFLLIYALAVYAQDITTKVSERRNPDGTLRHRIETTSRGNTPILRVYTRPSEQPGKLTTSRSYMVGGKLVMIETDENGDGFFETMVVIRDSNREAEMFTREVDGSVRPVSERELQQKIQAAEKEKQDEKKKETNAKSDER